MKLTIEISNQESYTKEPQSREVNKCCSAFDWFWPGLVIFLGFLFQVLPGFSTLHEVHISRIGRTKNTGNCFFKSGNKSTKKVSGGVPISFQLFHGLFPHFPKKTVRNQNFLLVCRCSLISKITNRKLCQSGVLIIVGGAQRPRQLLFASGFT